MVTVTVLLDLDLFHWKILQKVLFCNVSSCKKVIETVVQKNVGGFVDDDGIYFSDVKWPSHRVVPSVS